jgi:diacylglycerol kinase
MVLEGGGRMRNKFADENKPGYHPLRKIRVVFAGLSFAVRHDFSVAYKVVLSLVLVVVSAVLQQWVDFVVIVLATGVVLTAELFNSAVEGVCDFMETGYDERIRAIKDVAAAAAGVSIMVWLVVVGYEAFQLLGAS